jgi:toxin ParE1/3/4
MQLRLSARAKSDLDHIYLQGIERYGIPAAEEYITEINSRISLILRFPWSNTLRSDVRPPVRLQTHKGHIIVYRIQEEYIDVIRVLSRFQNWQERF